MKTVYSLTIMGRCPTDPSVFDKYDTTITVEGMVKVEDLIAKINALTAKPIFQEDLTQALADEFGEVRTFGTHSGVLTTCSA